MPQITITNEAREALRAAQQRIGRQLDNSAQPCKNGWQVHLSWPIIQALKQRQGEGETLSDVIVRIATTDDGRIMQ